ncbi:hypothetical protein [Janthinobacterium sp. PC23-8]|uniref:hypothetical protein n=1 Tax=Janthinobacterium sp. PC23-8 TaxID=2012679 RepID=UPI000B96795B|nr:hypothetical protein [Janthinobacterium sp. PC23-8]OYO25877.1 hypothetical protein CD932_27750 [Janthinobacterium sp. PC23-8]
MNQGDKTTPEEVYEEFSKALLATLHRTYADYLESKTDDADFKIVANYFHFFKKVISINPDL